MSGYRIDDGTATRIAQHHDEAADGIDESADGLPPVEIDAGPATPHLSEIMGVVARGLSSLSQANRGMAEIVRQTGDDFYATESEATEAFTTLASSLDDAS